MSERRWRVDLARLRITQDCRGSLTFEQALAAIHVEIRRRAAERLLDAAG